MFEANLNTDYLAAASLFRSNEETRYYLQGVYVAPWHDRETGTGVLMVATDGHRVGVFYDRIGTISEPRILTTDFKAKVLKTPAKEATPRRLKIEDDAGTVLSGEYGHTEGLIRVTDIKGTFPDFTRVVPKPAKGMPANRPFGVNPTYLDDVKKAFVRAGISGRDMGGAKAISITQNGYGDPTFIRCSSHDMFAVVMPCRVEETQLVPDFWQEGFQSSATEQAA